MRIIGFFRRFRRNSRESGLWRSVARGVKMPTLRRKRRRRWQIEPSEFALPRARTRVRARSLYIEQMSGIFDGDNASFFCQFALVHCFFQSSFALRRKIGSISQSSLIFMQIAETRRSCEASFGKTLMCRLLAF